jgi:hypothetical protein
MVVTKNSTRHTKHHGLMATDDLGKSTFVTLLPTLHQP